MHRRILLSCFALIFAAGCLFAAVKSTILGSVTDSSGAVVANASVRVKSETTNFTREVKTDNRGDFVVADLDPDRYSITVEAPGFKQAVRAAIQLDADQQLRSDMALTVGTVSEKVQVSGEAEQVETDTSSIRQTINRDMVNELPLNGRNFLSLALLVPGTNTGYPGNRQMGNELGGVSLAANGARSSSNNYMIDGVDNNVGFNGYFSLAPSVDAIQEFTVQTNSYSAELGRSAGAQVNVITRGGTNNWHGSLFEYLRNNDLDAANFFSNAAGITTNPPYHRNQFGGTFGGPIIIPHLYDGRNRTFFFVSYEGTRIRQAVTRTTTVPTVAERAGNFSGQAPVYDPKTGQPFPGNIIPADRIDATSNYLQALVPTPLSAATSGNFTHNAPYKDDIDQITFRFDQRIGQNGQLMGRFSYDERNVISPSSFGTPAIGDGGFGSGATETDEPRVTALDYTHAIRPTLLNDLRFGYNRFNWLYTQDNAGNNIAAAAGILGLPGDSTVVGFPQIGISGFDSWGDGGYLPNNTTPDETYQLVDTMTWIKGRHTVKFGFDIRRNHRYFLTGGSFRGSFNFSGIFTSGPENQTGNAYADFLLGYPSSASRTVGTNIVYSQTWFYDGFVQDDFHVSKRLTLNLGLRYEYNPPSTEKNNQINNFDFATGTLEFASSKYIPTNATYPVGQSFSNTTIHPDKDNFAPRVGLAYRLTEDNRTSLRAAYGIFYDVETGNPQLNLGFNPPFQFNTSAPINTAVATTQYQNAFAYTPQYGGFPSIEAIQQNFRDGYLQNWQVSLEREVTNGLMVEAAYVASKGTHLISRYDPNTPLPGPGLIQARRPYPDFAGMTYDGSFASSSYNSLQVKIEKRFSAGLSFLTSYTYSKSIDNSSDFTADSVPDPFNIGSYMRGPSDFDQTHRFVQSWLYQLPFGHGRKFLTDSRALDFLVGGWNANGIYTWGTGFPFTVYIPTDRANTGTGGQRPDVVGDWQVAHPTINEWFNPAAFALPAQYTFGDAGRNILRGPGFSNIDFSLMKQFRVTEKSRFEFRAEAFNLFNTAQFGYPSSTIGTSSAGKITYTINNPRQIQFALRFDF